MHVNEHIPQPTPKISALKQRIFLFFFSLLSSSMSSAFILESRNKDLPHACSGPPRGISCVLNDRLEETTQALSKKVPSVFIFKPADVPSDERYKSTTPRPKTFHHSAQWELAST